MGNTTGSRKKLETLDDDDGLDNLPSANKRVVKGGRKNSVVFN